MNALAPLPRCAETLAELFAPVDAEGLAPLFAEYARKRKAIAELADDFKVTRRLEALAYFVKSTRVSYFVKSPTDSTTCSRTCTPMRSRRSTASEAQTSARRADAAPATVRHDRGAR